MRACVVACAAWVGLCTGCSQPRVCAKAARAPASSHMHAWHQHACGTFVAAPWRRACALASNADAVCCSAPARGGLPTRGSEPLMASLRAAPCALAPRTRLLRRNRGCMMLPRSSATTPQSSAAAPQLEPRQAPWVSVRHALKPPCFTLTRTRSWTRPQPVLRCRLTCALRSRRSPGAAAWSLAATWITSLTLAASRARFLQLCRGLCTAVVLGGYVLAATAMRTGVCPAM